MKGTSGILTAAILGVIAAGCNWLYLHNLAANHAKVSFVAIGADVQLEVGDRFREQHFMKVDVPRSALGNLDMVAVRWEALGSVVGQTANRDYFGGEVLLHEDLVTPARRDLNTLISGEERVMWLPVDPRSFNAAHVNPGDLVSFKVPAFVVAQPAAAGATDTPHAPEEIIGPFEILALGNRKGRREIQRAAGVPPGSESNIAIRVSMESNQLEPKAQRIADVLQMTDFKGVQLLLHPASAQSGRP